MTEQEVFLILQEHIDEKYKDFTSKLIPTIDKNKILGVRIPILRKISLELWKQDKEFCLNYIDNKHFYFEEKNLCTYFIEQITNYETLIKTINKFLPEIDNWATCDSFNPKIFKNHLDTLIFQINVWIDNEHLYIKRFAINLLMRYFLDKKFKKEFLNKVSNIKTNEYYLQMSIAWYFSIALIKQYNIAIEYFVNRKLDKWIHNKSLQKAIESNRISKEVKEYFKTLKIK